MMILILLHMGLCLHLFYTVFARVVMTGPDILRAVRLVFCALGAAALWGLAAPIVAAWSPDAFSIVLLAAICATQHVTNRYWRGRAPDCFHRPGAQPRNRRSTDRETQEEHPR